MPNVVFAANLSLITDTNKNNKQQLNTKHMKESKQKVTYTCFFIVLYVHKFTLILLTDLTFTTSIRLINSLTYLLMLGGTDKRLERRSLAGGLSVIYGWHVITLWECPL